MAARAAARRGKQAKENSRPSNCRRLLAVSRCRFYAAPPPGSHFKRERAPPTQSATSTADCRRPLAACHCCLLQLSAALCLNRRPQPPAPHCLFPQPADPNLLSLSRRSPLLLPAAARRRPQISTASRHSPPLTVVSCCLRSSLPSLSFFFSFSFSSCSSSSSSSFSPSRSLLLLFLFLLLVLLLLLLLLLFFLPFLLLLILLLLSNAACVRLHNLFTF